MNLRKYFSLKGLNLFELSVVGIIIITLLIMFIPNRKGVQMQNFSRRVNAEINNVKWRAKGFYYKIFGAPAYNYDPTNGTIISGDIVRVPQ